MIRRIYIADKEESDLRLTPREAQLLIEQRLISLAGFRNVGTVQQWLYTSRYRVKHDTVLDAYDRLQFQQGPVS